MSRILVVTVAAIALALGVVALVPAPRSPSHCGCGNKDSCVEPCSGCCGPNGYADCWKNPSPTVATTRSGSCCEKGP